MCAPVYSLLLFTLTTTIFCGSMTATEGLPLGRRERGVDRGVLAGDDFLSVFMKSSRVFENSPTTTTTEQPTTTEQNTSTTEDEEITTTTEEIPTTTQKTSTRAPSSSDSKTASKSNSGVVVAVRVLSTSSADRTIPEEKPKKHEEAEDQVLVASEVHPSIIAKASKSDFGVEEPTPITTDTDSTSRGFERGYPASVQPLPRNSQSPYNPDSGYLGGENPKEKTQPLHHTLIYHNNPRDSARARSVSYSTVIQTVPHTSPDKTWDENKPMEHERRERHYEGVQPAFANAFRELPKNSTQKTWSPLTTERNWEVREKPYPPRRLPTVYGVPEQNYEVDESASVMTNGRLHGVQVAPTSRPPKEEAKSGDGKKSDDNQKVGYVVEGRNYRKYRVEERTSDGFIVGEYGVVSHDDGSLRGVRYTADGTINPRLIYDALMKFLAL